MSKRNKPKPAAKTLRDKRKAKEARRAKHKAKARINGIKAPAPTYEQRARQDFGPLSNLIALGMLGLSPRLPPGETRLDNRQHCGIL